MSRRRGLSTFARVVVGAVLLVLTLAGPVAADPAGPTDYLTTIDSIEPPTSAISVRMIGGDSFFEVTQLEPVHILITGYRGEPYLRIRANGVVEENRLAPTTYLNEERYGAGEIVPAFADPDADPQWVQVATGGRYAWHDHRSHWMNEAKPPGTQPGDTILEAVVPMIVDGTQVQVSVSSVLQEGASPIPPILGVVLADWIVLYMVSRRSPLIAIGPAVIVLAAGLVWALSVPPETGPPVTLWVPPLLAIVALAAAAVARVRASNPLVEVGLVAVAGLQLLLWGFLGWSVFIKPVLPTDLPWSAHRFITAMALVVGLGLIIVAARQVQAVFSRPALSQRT